MVGQFGAADLTDDKYAWLEAEDEKSGKGTLTLPAQSRSTY